MPQWADENGRFWWTPPGKTQWEQVEIPHAPVGIEKRCKCAYCTHERKRKQGGSDDGR